MFRIFFITIAYIGLGGYTYAADKNCQNDLGNCTGTIINKTDPDDLDANVTDYIDCACQESTQDNTHGRRYKIHTWQAGTGTETQWKTNEDLYIITNCSNGYCSNNRNGTNAKCEPIPAGYYEDKALESDIPGHSWKCIPCPAGSTSDGVTEITEHPAQFTKQNCYITNATKFKDKKGTFTLPIPENPKIYWNLNSK